MQLDPRTGHILFILLKAHRPISVDEIATQLSISRRTLYRDLKNAAPILNAWHLELQTISGQGISLAGRDADRDGLLAQIQQSDAFDPRNRTARQTLLKAMLLRQTEAKKIFYFASALQVSESTVSNDLQELVSWFAQYDLEIRKRPGFGIDLEGREKDFRLACLRLARDCREHDFAERIRQQADSEVFQLLDKDWFYQLYALVQDGRQSGMLHMTEGSLLTLTTYLTIASCRMAAGCYLESDRTSWRMDQQLMQPLSDLIARMEEKFDLRITHAEAKAIEIYFKGAKPGYLDRQVDLLQDDEELAGLIGEMLDCFDPGARFYLESDPDFLQALAAHLRPMLVRLEHKIQVDNPLLHEVQQSYPDLYQKAVDAGEIIQKRLGYTVPACETGLLAMHFGGALLRYHQTIKPKRQVRIAVVCSSGIGVSRLLTSQLQNAFDGKVQLLVYGEAFQDLNAARVDFVITTFPLEVKDKKILQVHPILGDADIEQIHQYISFYALQPDLEDETLEDTGQFTDSVHRMAVISQDASTLLHDFALHQVPADINFDQLTRFFALQFGTTESEQEQIYQDITKRERIFTQVIPQYRLALLHAKTAGAVKPGFQIAYPTDSCFTDPYFEHCAVAIGMVAPAVAGRDEVMGAVSDMLFARDDLMEAIQTRQTEQIRLVFQRLMRDYLKNNLQDIL